MIFLRQKLIIEKDINTKTHATRKSELYTLKLVHQLDKALFLKSPSEYEKFYEMSNETIDEIFATPKRIKKMAVWNDIYFSLFAFSVGLIAYEVWPFNRLSYYIFIVSLFWILLGTSVYGIIDAKADSKITREQDERVEGERKSFSNWKKDLHDQRND